jgi:hypothetical protein
MTTMMTTKARTEVREIAKKLGGHEDMGAINLVFDFYYKSDAESAAKAMRQVAGVRAATVKASRGGHAVFVKSTK